MEELNKLKHELRELFELVVENSSRTDKISFSDGTPYSKEELERRLLDIRFRVNFLKNYEDELGIVKAVDFDCDCYGLGAERLIQLYVADPNFIQHVIIDSYGSRVAFYSSDYKEVYNQDKSIDEVLIEWYRITAGEIERSGLQDFIEIKDNYGNLIRNDVTRYGERFMKAYPEYFLEDTNLPEEIKQEFYNVELTLEEYEQYKDEFEGKLVGLGIEDRTSLEWRVETRNFSELIRHDLVAMKYFQKNYKGSKLERRYREFYSDDDIEEIKKKFDEVVEDEINFKKNRILNAYTGAKAIKDEELFRTRLPEFFLDDDAPEELVEAYYDETLELSDFKLNPEWVKWLEDKEPEYIKIILDDELYDWAFNGEGKELTEEVNEYLSIVYEEEMRKEIIDGLVPWEYALNDAFMERNSDIFFDDLPEELRRHFKDRDWSIKDVFELSEEDKKLLKGKQIYMAFPEGLEKEFCKEHGGDSEAFQIYEKYAGLMELIVTAGNVEYESLEEMIEETAIIRIKDSPYGYSDKVPEEYKEEHSEYFLDKDAPKGLKDKFYKNGFYKDMTFKLLRNNPDYVPFLKGKHIKHLFKSDYKDFFEFCGDQDEALRLGIKYGDYVEHLLFDLRFNLAKAGEELLEEKIYDYIINHGWDYSDLGDEFKNKYPELFLMDEDMEKLSNLSDKQIKLIRAAFYNKKIDFLILRDYPQLAEILQTKDVSILKEGRARYLRDSFEGDIKAILDIGVEYGNILLETNFRMYFEENANYGEVEDIRKEFDQLIRSCILEKELLYNEDLPERFKLNNPELFLTEADMTKIPYVQEDMFKKAFYSREITLEMLKDYPELKEVIYNKNLGVCAGNRGFILGRFTRLLGDRRKAYDLITGKLAEKLDDIAESNDFLGDLAKTITYYKEAGFIPDMVIIDKLPEDKIKGFALNRKLWAKIVKDRGRLNEDYLGSLLEAAMVMGVFETKEFTRNGKVMIQGNGEKGYKRLQKFLSYVPSYIGNSYIAGEENCEEAKGCIKIRGDFFEELLYEKIESAAIECDLIEEFVDGELDDYDISRILRDVEYNVDEEDCFVKGEDDFYSCIVDRDIDKKIKMLFKTIGIKDDFVLTPDEVDLIEKFDISKAFKGIDEDDNVPYKFNMSKKDDKFVIGKDYDISEEQSKENKKLFVFIKFLMAEYGLEGEAARLGANNDRSNIDLVLSFEQMDTLNKALDKISNAALDRYSAETNLWKVKEGADINYVTNDRIHQIFDGLKMEYSPEFSQFMLDNMETVIRFGDMYPNINSIQEKVIELSKDPDYANQEITPIVVLRALSEISYNDTKVGFEKGKELAQKFVFGQEYYELAQEIWDEARKREASTIPRVQGKDGRCSYEVLRLDDATGIYAGNITNCCQKLGGAGETAMLHSMKEKHGRVFVVRDESQRIIAQSWLWRNGDTICFDNVEIPISADNKENQDAIYAVLKKVAKELCDKDAEVVARLLEEGQIDEETAKRMRAKKVTVGKGNTDIDEIARNDNEELEDDECKEPIGVNKYYKGTDEEKLYISDSREQVILYKEENYKKEENQVNISIHFDDNTTKNCLELTNSELRMMRNIEEEVQEDSKIDTIVGLLEQYEVKPEELNAVIGTDWFMLYSEKDEDITVHKVLKSPSSGIMRKSIKEQRQAVQMLMDKGKNISMEVENDRVHRAARSMVRHMEKRYTMKVADEEDRMMVSEISQR